MTARHFIFFLLAFIFANHLKAQSTEKYLTRHAMEDGILLYLKPQDWKGSGQKAIAVDFTLYLAAEKETCTVGISRKFASPSESQISSINLGLAGEAPLFINDNLEPIFLEKKGKKWIDRYRIDIPVELLMTLLGSDILPSLGITQPQQTTSRNPGKQWQKMKEVILPTLEFELKKNRQN